MMVIGRDDRALTALHAEARANREPGVLNSLAVAAAFRDMLEASGSPYRRRLLRLEMLRWAARAVREAS